ncbi:MAG: hypothetical protein IJG68_02660 [Bacilli bacterium]|nr:hypothetical protein [Bacilli bacterium]
MDILSQLFQKFEINRLVLSCPELQFIEKDNTRKILKLLVDNGCSNRVLRSIIIMNPSFLLRSYDSIFDLVKCFNEYGIENIDLMLLTYPFILDKTPYEIDNFYIKKRQEGYSNEDIGNILEVEGALIEE